MERGWRGTRRHECYRSGRRLDRVYRTNDGRVAHRATFPGGKAPLLAVVPTAKVNEFATFTAGGVVRVYQVPG
jgi:hypothetical protein